MSKKFPFYQQLDLMVDASNRRIIGPVRSDMFTLIPLGIVAKYYGLSYTLQELRDKSGIGREGVSLLGISEAAASIGFRTVAARLSYEQLLTMPQPCILHWKDNHFVVLVQHSPPAPDGGATYVPKIG